MLQNKTTHPMLQGTTQIKNIIGHNADVFLLKVYCKLSILDGFVGHPLIFKFHKLKCPTPGPEAPHNPTSEGNMKGIGGPEQARGGVLNTRPPFGQGGVPIQWGGSYCMWGVRRVFLNTKSGLY